MAEPQKIQPRPTAVSAPYFEGCRDGELRLQQCVACDRHQFYPRIVCSHCGADGLRWQAVSGAGRIASYTVVRRSVSAAYEAPYIVALIELTEGPRMMSQIVHIEADDARLRIGASVCVEFQAWSEEIDLPVFRLLEEQ